MPQMGESVAEGTIVRWLKKVGDAVERDEPLFEISTDKVDAEFPSPSAGVLSEVKVQEGATVPINTVVAVIDETASASAPAGPSARQGVAKPAASAPGSPPAPDAPPAPSAPKARVSAPQGDGDDQGRFGPYAPVVPSASNARVAPKATPAPTAPIAPSAKRAPAPVAPAPVLSKPWSAAEARELRLSPVVRRIAREHPSPPGRLRLDRCRNRRCR